MPSKGYPVLVTVFFFWGFVAASNDILMPVLKSGMNLSQAQSQWISVAFYIAYSVGAILYMIISEMGKKDLLERLGYRNGISIGLCISAAGTLLFIPAAEYNSYGWLLTGLFTVGLGFSLQQTAANPLAINMGSSEKASQRLSLAGGINNIGTTIGPILISVAIFGEMGKSEGSGLEQIKMPYLMLGGAFLLVAMLFRLSPVQNHMPTVSIDPKKTGSNVSQHIFKPQLILGMLAIFLYVGVEVASAGNLGELLQQEYNIKQKNLSVYVSLFWASLMIGRWTSASAVFTDDKRLIRLLSVILPYLAFGLFFLVNEAGGNATRAMIPYALPVAMLIAADFISNGKPDRQLIIYGTLGAVALIVGMLTSGELSIFAFLSCGLFCSTLWPCIFTLSIKGYGENTGKASGYLIMMIMGGGWISYLQGSLAHPDMLGVKYSYLTGVVCFAYLAFFGWWNFRQNQIKI